ncbi:hypothetical protein FB451DRAFT_1375519 [Mycena latifolia]|nr:hypothetical protein FB451DRAFT_1375519 [Mycena latifolia]
MVLIRGTALLIATSFVTNAHLANILLRKGMRNLVLRFFLAQFHCAALFADNFAAAMDLNQTLLTPENNRLPEGTYIATGLSGVAHLDDYITDHPDTTITRLLISDSTVPDVNTGHGYVSSDVSDFDFDYRGSKKRPTLTDEEEDRLEDIRHNNAKVSLKLKRAMRDLEAPLKRVLDKAAPSLVAFTFLTYISNPGSHSYDGYPGAVGEHSDPRIKALLGRGYPSLTHFTFWNQHIDDASDVLKHHPSRFPGLTHLQIDHLYHTLPSLASLLDDFPTLTHLLITGVGSMYSLPSELNPPYPVQGWTEYFKENLMGIRGPKFPPLTIPGNLTVFIQPRFSPMLEDIGFCGTPGVEYDEMIARLADAPDVHLKFPSEEEFRSGGSSFPLQRAIAEFEDQARGGEGEWAVPGRVPDRKDWWWKPQPDKKEESEL